MEKSREDESEIKSKKVPRYQEINGMRRNICVLPDMVQSAIDYKPTAKDIFVATYPKCGTTWMVQIVTLILRNGKLANTSQEYFASCPFIETVGAEEIANIPKGKGCIKTHLPFNLIPYSSDAKYIYVARNPRDCCISFYYHTKFIPSYYFTEGTFDDFFDLFLEGKVDFNDYFDNLLSWYEYRNNPNIFFVTFEEMKADLRGTVKKVAEFLGEEFSSAIADNDELLLSEIVHKSTFQSMKDDINNFWKERIDNCKSLYADPTMSRSSRWFAKCQIDAIEAGEVSVGQFVRAGIVENKNVLSPEQEKRLKLRILEKTRESDVMQLWSQLKWGDGIS